MSTYGHTHIFLLYPQHQSTPHYQIDVSGQWTMYERNWLVNIRMRRESRCWLSWERVGVSSNSALSNITNSKTWNCKCALTISVYVCVVPFRFFHVYIFPICLSSSHALHSTHNPSHALIISSLHVQGGGAWGGEGTKTETTCGGEGSSEERLWEHCAERELRRCRVNYDGTPQDSNFRGICLSWVVYIVRCVCDWISILFTLSLYCH